VVVDDKDVVERWEGGKFGGRDGRDGDLEVGDWTAGDSLKGDGVWTRTRKSVSHLAVTCHFHFHGNECTASARGG
jgi:hypothetical protein